MMRINYGSVPKDTNWEAVDILVHWGIAADDILVIHHSESVKFSSL